MSPPGSAGWPLSAVATELLLLRPVPRVRLVSLSLRELVVSGTWVLGTRPAPLRAGTRRRATLAPGGPVPDRPPLGLVDARLRALATPSADLLDVAPRLASDPDLGPAARAAAQDDLVRRGLAVLAPRRLRGPRLVRTPDGDVWVRGLVARRAAWRDALRRGGPEAEAALAELGRAPGLVPLLDRTVLRDVDRLVRGAGGAGGWGDLGLPGLVDWGGLCAADGGLGGALGRVERGTDPDPEPAPARRRLDSGTDPYPYPEPAYGTDGSRDSDDDGGSDSGDD